MKKEKLNKPQTEQCNIHDVVARFKVNGYLYGKEVWVFTDYLRVAEKVQQDAECNAICSIIYEWTDDGWI